MTPDGRFHPVIWPGRRELEERFRRRFLALLRQAHRLSASFHETLLSWRRSGFSVEASQRVAVGETERLRRLARYATRVPLAAGAVRERPDGRIEVATPPDPRTGARVRLLDRLDFVHAVCQQIPDARLHQVRYDGAYATRTRQALRRAFDRAGDPGAADALPRAGRDASAPPPPAAPDAAEARRRRAWARLLRKVFEVEPLVCPRCGVEMEIVARITEGAVLDRIVRHRVVRTESGQIFTLSRDRPPLRRGDPSEKSESCCAHPDTTPSEWTST